MLNLKLEAEAEAKAQTQAHAQAEAEAKAQAQAGSKVELVGRHFVESMTKVVTDTATGASDELTDIVTTTGKDVPVRR